MFLPKTFKFNIFHLSTNILQTIKLIISFTNNEMTRFEAKRIYDNAKRNKDRITAIQKPGNIA